MKNLNLFVLSAVVLIWKIQGTNTQNNLPKLTPERVNLPKGRLEKLSPGEVADYNRINKTNY
ncbi:hypothetical protein [Algoriphagus sp. Y33]|uniref:hypothetical protein n=1 Tax=Algoriphagus sp. Y33 TaxID=2772483 RepID=UPI00178569C2|nr:hypothetical protein [Algoriphagus sp. Y33]